MNLLRLAPAAIVACMLSSSNLSADEQSLLFREDFNDLANWSPLSFPKIKNHSSYHIQTDREGSLLKASSHRSASALIYKQPFNVYEYPLVRWRWKVKNVYTKGDAKTKAGDDYPLRIYIVFKFDPQKARFLDRVKYQTARLLYGQYPPHSSLNYIWANKSHNESILTSPYTNQSKMIPLQTGTLNVGTWQTQEVDILSDYQRAFGNQPPPEASIAIMNDSDNTGERSVAYLDFIEVYRNHPSPVPGPG